MPSESTSETTTGMTVAFLVLNTFLVLKTRASLARKLSVEHAAIATALAATGSIAKVPLRIPMMARLPTSETLPFKT